MFRFCFIFLVILFSCGNKQSGEKGNLTGKPKFDYTIIPSAHGGDSILKGDIVKVHLQQYIDDSLLADSRNRFAVYVKIDSTLREFDFPEILPLMKVNDSAVCTFPVKEIMKRNPVGSHLPPFIEKGKNIRVFLKVIDKFESDSLTNIDFQKDKRIYDSMMVLKEKAANENAKASFDSLTRSLKQPYRKLPNGVFVQIIEKGKGAKIVKGDTVAVTYKGMLIDGTPFDSNTPQTPYMIKVGFGGSVEGFDSGIASLSFGDKAKLFIPSNLGYGAQGKGDRIPPFTNLVFEVQVNPGGNNK